MASSRVPSPVGRPTFPPPPPPPPSIEALMLDLSLIEEPLFKDSNEEVISALGAMVFILCKATFSSRKVALVAKKEASYCWWDSC